MTPFDSPMPHAGRHTPQSRGDGAVRQIFVGIAALLSLLLIGQRAAAAFDSPLLAVVAVGMVFLIGVAVHGAVGHGRRWNR